MNLGKSLSGLLWEKKKEKKKDVKRTNEVPQMCLLLLALLWRLLLRKAFGQRGSVPSGVLVVVGGVRS